MRRTPERDVWAGYDRWRLSYPPWWDDEDDDGENEDEDEDEQELGA